MKVIIDVISPLIINSTDYINIPMVIENRDRHSLNMLDMENILMNSSSRKKLTDLFMEYFNSGNPREIFDKLQEYYTKLQNINNFKIYPEIEYDELDIKSSNISLPIGNYMDNRYVPYLPGSSLKGAIRNALRNNYIKLGGRIEVDKPQKGSMFDHLIFYKQPERGNKQVTDDVMKFIEITDFYPVDNEYKLKIHKIVRTKSGFPSQKIPSYAVTLDHGKFEGEVKINKSLKALAGEKFDTVSRVFKNLGVNLTLESDYDNNIKQILNIAADYYRDIINSEENYYKNKISDKPMALGFGGGIEEKTVIPSLDDYNFNEAVRLIKSKDRKIHFEGRKPSTHWEINGQKFGVVDLIYE